jgi:hypothetical protein
MRKAANQESSSMSSRILAMEFRDERRDVLVAHCQISGYSNGALGLSDATSKGIDLL